MWGDDPALGALLLEAIPDETPLAERRAAVELDEVASLIEDLHRAGPPAVAEGWERLADRVEFIFGHWLERHGRRGARPGRHRPTPMRRRRAATGA